jgi:hypothetical protein
VEDVRYAEREAEDYAEHAGPGEEYVSFRAQCGKATKLAAHTIVRIYLEEIELATVNNYPPPMALGRSLLKFRDLNSSASVMTGEDVRCCGSGDVVVVYKRSQEVYSSGGGGM